MKPAVRKIALERMQILINNAISNAKTNPNFLKDMLTLHDVLVRDITFECLTTFELYFVKNANLSLHLE